MSRRRPSAKRTRDIVVSPNGISGEALMRARALEVWARTGKRPANLERWVLDSDTADAVLNYMGVTALAMQHKAMERGLEADASVPEITVGAMTAKNVLDRKLGRPVERVEATRHIAIIFSGLDPDALPSAPPEDATEIVDVSEVTEDD